MTSGRKKNIPPTAIEPTVTTAIMLLIRAASGRRSGCRFRRLISGVKTETRLPIKANGKKRIGIAMPLILPNCASATDLSPE